MKPLNPSATDPTTPAAAEENPRAPGPPIRFRGFDALRFYAAISIVINHTNQNFGDIRTMPANIPLLNLLIVDAQSAVNLLLVLSGFLITYLIFREQEAKGRLDTARFYLRRILRTWPLYYLTVVIGIWIVPALLGTPLEWTSTAVTRLILVLLIMPNFVAGLAPGVEHLWCIGLQNQFYLIWPRVTRPPVESFLKIVFGILIIKLGITPVIYSFHSDSISNIFHGLRFECMAIGALGAYVLIHQPSLLRILRGLPARAVALGLMGFLAVVDLPLTEPAIFLSSGIFMLFILTFFTGSALGEKLDVPLLTRLGEMSYGIYMFHYPLLFVVLTLFNRAGMAEGPAYTAVLHCTVIGGTLLLAALSYHFFEMPFLRAKKRFSVIRTGP
jgi:peptidoglycan/LPS O-acetylase OafA/YrhL